MFNKLVNNITMLLNSKCKTVIGSINRNVFTIFDYLYSNKDSLNTKNLILSQNCNFMQYIYEAYCTKHYVLNRK